MFVFVLYFSCILQSPKYYHCAHEFFVYRDYIVLCFHRLFIVVITREKKLFEFKTWNGHTKKAFKKTAQCGILGGFEPRTFCDPKKWTFTRWGDTHVIYRNLRIHYERKKSKKEAYAKQIHHIQCLHKARPYVPWKFKNTQSSKNMWTIVSRRKFINVQPSQNILEALVSDSLFNSFINTDFQCLFAQENNHPEPRTVFAMLPFN